MFLRKKDDEKQLYSKQNKKGTWIVELGTQYLANNNQYQFTIFNNGRATLFITGNNKSTITFDGYV